MADKQTSNDTTAKDGATSGASSKPNDGGYGKIPDVVKFITGAPRRNSSPRKRIGDASQLDTADDDKYDDAWLPEYGEGPADEEIVEEEWVEVKKPKPTR